METEMTTNTVTEILIYRKTSYHRIMNKFV